MPDDVDISLILSGRLPKCPFCGGKPVTFNRVNDKTKIFRSVVSCANCMAQVGYNSKDLHDARRGATERWMARRS